MTRDTTAQHCMELALSSFGLQEVNIDNFEMITVLVDKAIIDRKLEPEERPFSIIQAIDKVGTSLLIFTRWSIGY